jgi:hypothetical protein
MPAKPGPRRYEAAVMKLTMPGPPLFSKTFYKAQRQK